jgi:hypothetical protein
MDPGDIVRCKGRSGLFRILAIHADDTATLTPMDESWVKRIYPPLSELIQEKFVSLD